jgi:hypothetical protein
LRNVARGLQQLDRKGIAVGAGNDLQEPVVKAADVSEQYLPLANSRPPGMQGVGAIDLGAKGANERNMVGDSRNGYAVVTRGTIGAATLANGGGHVISPKNLVFHKASRAKSTKK